LNVTHPERLPNVELKPAGALRRGDCAAFRICRAAEADLASEAACRSNGRWNSPGRAMVYMSDSPALALLELRVHLELTHELLPDDFVLVAATIPPDLPVETLASMPENPVAYGDRWLDEARSALMMVPSVIVPEGSNVLLNPRHPDAALITVADHRPFRFDRRLWTPLA
jgi:RES domain-containing protein